MMRWHLLTGVASTRSAPVRIVRSVIRLQALVLTAVFRHGRSWSCHNHSSFSTLVGVFMGHTTQTEVGQCISKGYESTIDFKRAINRADGYKQAHSAVRHKDERMGAAWSETEYHGRCCPVGEGE